MFLFNAGSGKYGITAKVHILDSGLIVTLYGGEKSHVGSVVVAIPRPSLQDPSLTSATSSVINLVAHKDEDVARPLAELLAKNLNQVVVVTAGIHISQATLEDIDILKKNVDEVTVAMLTKLEIILK